MINVGVRRISKRILLKNKNMSYRSAKKLFCFLCSENYIFTDLGEPDNFTLDNKF